MKKETDKELEVFMKNIVWLRKKNGLTKKEMAEVLGISVHSLNKIEKGVFPPRTPVEIVVRIHSRFGILPSQMITRLFRYK